MSFEVDSVDFAYAHRPVLQGVSLSLAAGHFYGVLGPNGCGKTTLLDLLAGHRRPAAGAIRYRQKALGGYSRRALAAEIALVPQDFYINFPFTAQEIVMMGRYPFIPRFAAPSAGDHQRVREIMAATGIWPLRGALVTELSGGERQRVVFARALAQDTRVLLLDEATSNLDIGHCLDLLTLTAGAVRTAGKTVIAVFQNVNQAAAFCDRLVFMKAGGVVAHGATGEVLRAETLGEVFGVSAEVSYNTFAGAHQVAFRKSAA
jgi:iron complex transport system ATP-binding protein